MVFRHSVKTAIQLRPETLHHRLWHSRWDCCQFQSFIPKCCFSRQSNTFYSRTEPSASVFNCGACTKPLSAPCIWVRATHLVFLRISSTSCLMWSSINSIFSCFRARAFCRRTMRSTSTALSTSGKLSTTTTEGPDWLSGERSSTPLFPA